MGFIITQLLGIFASAVDRFDSLYESFQALTSVQRSHFVEWFSGSDINAIWDKVNHSGTGTFAMADSVDGGFQYTTDSALAGNSGYIYFNDKRHYDFDDSMIIGIMKVDDATNRQQVIGGADGMFFSGSYFIMENDSVNSFYTLESDGSQTNSSIAIDTSWHVHSTVLNGTNMKYYIDGVLEVTKTTNYPTGKYEPVCFMSNRSVAGAKTGRFRYLELFNGSVSSLLYERLSALTQVMGQRVVETFSGNAIDSDRWTEQSYAGSPTFAMDDASDGGFKINTGTSSNARGEINFNGKKHMIIKMLFVLQYAR